MKVGMKVGRARVTLRQALLGLDDSRAEAKLPRWRRTPPR